MIRNIRRLSCVENRNVWKKKMSVHCISFSQWRFVKWRYISNIKLHLCTVRSIMPSRFDWGLAQLVSLFIVISSGFFASCAKYISESCGFSLDKNMLEFTHLLSKMCRKIKCFLEHIFLSSGFKLSNGILCFGNEKMGGNMRKCEWFITVAFILVK